MDKTSPISRSTTAGVNKRVIALFDVHVPRQINLSGVLSFIKDRKPTDLVLGGDAMNFEFLSHWNDAVFPTIGFERIRKLANQEFEAGQQFLESLTKVLPSDCNKWYIPGNHERFLIDAAVKYPQIAGSIDLGIDKLTFKSDIAQIKKQVLADLLRKFLKTDDYGFKVLPFEKELMIGKLTFIHGHQVSGPAAMQKKYPARNVICGHHHSELVLTTNNSGDEKRANQYVMVPCLTKLAPGYLSDSSTRWLNGLYSADILPSGLFAGHVVKVIEGKVIYNGQVYS